MSRARPGKQKWGMLDSANLHQLFHRDRSPVASYGFPFLFMVSLLLGVVTQPCRPFIYLVHVNVRGEILPLLSNCLRQGQQTVMDSCKATAHSNIA